MSTPVVISVENLGKNYRISHQAERQRYVALRDVIADKFQRLFRPGNGHAGGRATTEEFWALQDVSFEVRQGEVVGIIGRNGAGKSTLLKILSRITEPTKGRVRIKGRVASLLEVGTGFHPELTGRENIYLNGAILGMSRAEIKSKFDEIVSFAEVEKFLDTPVKRYSSGMYVRLAFAVAAHLEPEILIVDEVLAVGDAQFQKKCLGKMQDVSKGGRTVLFVSHNMGAVRALCTKCLFLETGKVNLIGDPVLTISSYMSGTAPELSSGERTKRRRAGTGQIHIAGISLENASSDTQKAYSIGEPIHVKISYQVNQSDRGSFFILITSHEGIVVLSSFQRDNHEMIDFHYSGSVVAHIADVDLAPGNYSLSAGIVNARGEFIEWLEDISHFEIISHFYDGRPPDQRLGLFSKKFSWLHSPSKS